MKKYLLIFVGSGRDELLHLTPHLKALNFEVGWIAQSEQAREVLSSADCLSLVLIDATDTAETERGVVSFIRERQPRLPIIWIQRKGAVPIFSGPPPDVILQGHVEPDVLTAVAATLLRERFYTRGLVDDLVASVVGIGRESFGTELTPADPVLKSTTEQISGLSTLLYFAGSGVAGHVIAGAAPEYLITLHQRLLPNIAKPTLEQLADLLGELANQVVGRLRSQHGLVFDVGAPLLVRGANVVVRQVAGSPALLVSFHDGPSRIDIELCLHRFDERLTVRQVTSSLPPGELVFL
ncbi:MAG: chemotaxis protein CheX [Myxococcota bacterium]